MKQQVRSTLLVLTAYFLLTAVMTWPTVGHLSDAIPGDGFDGWQNYWNLWWVKEALVVLGAHPFFTHYLYAPAGVSLLFHTLNIFNGLWTLPIQLNFGLAVAYNSVVLVSFSLAGYGGYLLCLHTLNQINLSKRGLRGAAFVGGLVFTMSPFHMAHLLGHMQVFSMIWPPFYILWLLRTLEPWATTRPRSSARQWRNTAMSVLFLILATLVDWYHTLYLLIFTGLLLLWTLWQRWRSQPLNSKLESRPRSGLRSRLDVLRHHPLLRPLGIVIAIGLGFGVLLSPLLWPMVQTARARPDLQTGLVQNITLSADLLAFVTPSEMHPLWGDWARQIADNFSSTTSERLIFAGFIPLALALFAAIRGWSRQIVRFWVTVTVLFFVLALGPYLHVGGKLVTIGDWPVPMPYLLFYHTVPFIGLTRSLSRYDLMVMLGLGLLVAIGLVQLSNAKTAGRLPRPHVTLPLIAAGLICFEFLSIPYPLSKIEIPTFYYQIAGDPENYTIAELPMNWDRPTPLLHQTVHGKPLLTAYTSRNNPLELAWRTPVFQQWRYLGPDIIDQPLPEIAPTIFHDFNLRYIVLDYWQMPPGPEREATERWLAAALPQASPIYDDGRLKVYQSPARPPSLPYLTLGDGWGERELTEAGQPVRALMANEGKPAELFLHHPKGWAIELKFTVESETPQHLTVLAGGKPAGKIEVSEHPSPETIAIPCSQTEGELIELNLASPNPASPVSVRKIGLRVEECQTQE